MGSEWILGGLAWGGCGLDSTVCCKCGDEPSGSCATELVNLSILNKLRAMYTIGQGFPAGVPRCFSVPRNFVILIYITKKCSVIFTDIHTRLLVFFE
jgi:hypothetical protein